MASCDPGRAKREALFKVLAAQMKRLVTEIQLGVPAPEVKPSAMPAMANCTPPTILTSVHKSIIETLEILTSRFETNSSMFRLPNPAVGELPHITIRTVITQHALQRALLRSVNWLSRDCYFELSDIVGEQRMDDFFPLRYVPSLNPVAQREWDKYSAELCLYLGNYEYIQSLMQYDINGQLFESDGPMRLLKMAAANVSRVMEEAAAAGQRLVHNAACYIHKTAGIWELNYDMIRCNTPAEAQGDGEKSLYSRLRLFQSGGCNGYAIEWRDFILYYTEVMARAAHVFMASQMLSFAWQKGLLHDSCAQSINAAGSSIYTLAPIIVAFHCQIYTEGQTATKALQEDIKSLVTVADAYAIALDDYLQETKVASDFDAWPHKKRSLHLGKLFHKHELSDNTVLGRMLGKTVFINSPHTLASDISWPTQPLPNLVSLLPQ